MGIYQRFLDYAKGAAVGAGLYASASLSGGCANPTTTPVVPVGTPTPVVVPAVKSANEQYSVCVSNDKEGDLEGYVVIGNKQGDLNVVGAVGGNEKNIELDVTGYWDEEHDKNAEAFRVEASSFDREDQRGYEVSVGVNLHDSVSYDADNKKIDETDKKVKKTVIDGFMGGFDLKFKDVTYVDDKFVVESNRIGYGGRLGAVFDRVRFDVGYGLELGEDKLEDVVKEILRESYTGNIEADWEGGRARLRYTNQAGQGIESSNTFSVDVIQNFGNYILGASGVFVDPSEGENVDSDPKRDVTFIFGFGGKDKSRAVFDFVDRVQDRSNRSNTLLDIVKLTLGSNFRHVEKGKSGTACYLVLRGKEHKPETEMYAVFTHLLRRKDSGLTCKVGGGVKLSKEPSAFVGIGLEK